MTSLAITGIGTFTSVGTNTPTTMAALVNNVQLFDTWGGIGPDAIEATVAPTALARGTDGVRRLYRMAALALRESSNGWQSREHLPVILCCPADEGDGVSAEAVLSSIVAEEQLPIERAGSVVMASGREGLAQGVRLAQDLIHGRRAAGCLLVAVDSLLIRRRLLRLWRERLLFDVADNPGGFIPGEGAVALRLEAARGGSQVPRIAGMGVAGETDLADAGAVGSGQTLSAALQRAMTDQDTVGGRLAASVAIDSVSSQLGQELAFAKTRPPLEEASELQTFYPSICVGEAGIATSLLGVALLAFLFSKGVASGPGLALFTGSGARRAAVAVAGTMTRRSG